MMTRAEIDAMPAGPEMDALVAEKVMGWKVYRGSHNGYDLYDGDYAQGFPPGEPIDGVPFDIDEYSTDIRAAWEVVEALKFPDIRINREGKWAAIFRTGIGFYAEAETAQLAICRAALKAVLK